MTLAVFEAVTRNLFEVIDGLFTPRKLHTVEEQSQIFQSCLEHKMLHISSNSFETVSYELRLHSSFLAYRGYRIEYELTKSISFVVYAFKSLKLFRISLMAAKVQIIRCNRLSDIVSVTEDKIREVRALLKSEKMREEATRVKDMFTVVGDDNTLFEVAEMGHIQKGILCYPYDNLTVGGFVFPFAVLQLP